jgi:phosphoglycerol transferase MdoB-like AlkP superfamily enzyme
VKVDVTMKKNIFKRILESILEGVKSSFKWLYKNRQALTYVFVLIISVSYFVYVLGYSTNWAMVISESRGGSFYRASQSANRLMGELGFITVLVVLLTLSFGSIKRKKFYISNIVLSILSSILLIVSALITLYYNSVLTRMYARITEDEVPAYLYVVHGAGEKSFQVFKIGNVLSIFMIIAAVMLVLFLVQKLRAQKERARLIEKMVVSHEH